MLSELWHLVHTYLGSLEWWFFFPQTFLYNRYVVYGVKLQTCYKFFLALPSVSHTFCPCEWICYLHSRNILSYLILFTPTLGAIPSMCDFSAFSSSFPSDQHLQDLPVGHWGPYSGLWRTTPPPKQQLTIVRLPLTADSFPCCPVVPCIELKQDHLSCRL